MHADFGAAGAALGNIGAALTAGNAPSATELQAIAPLQVADGVYAYVQGEFSHTSEIILDGSNDPFAIQESCNVVNLRFFMNFEQADVDVVVWARNLLDEEYINRTNFNTPIQDGKLNACMAEPDTFGVTVKKRF